MAALAVAGGLAVAACGNGSSQVSLDNPSLIAPAPAPAVAPTTVAPTTVAPTTVARRTVAPPTTRAPAVTHPTTTTIALPVPLPPPVDFGMPGPEVGSITIPRIGLNLPLFTGVNIATLDEGGAGLWPGTAQPGNLGNAVIAAHRVSHGGPFRNIDKLKIGDQVSFTVGKTSSTYAVTSTGVVTPETIQIIDQTPAYTATLFACHPPGSTKFRYVVKLKLVSAHA